MIKVKNNFFKQNQTKRKKKKNRSPGELTVIHGKKRVKSVSIKTPTD